MVPPHPPIQKLRALAAPSAIVLLCRPNKGGSALEVASILKGQALYQKHKDAISKFLPRGDTEALRTDGFAEIFFFQEFEGPTGVQRTSSYALWPERVDTLKDGQGRDRGQIRFLAHDIKELKRVIGNDANMAEEAGADQSATAPESEQEGSQNPKSESEVRSR